MQGEPVLQDPLLPSTFSLKDLSCSKCRQRAKSPAAGPAPCLLKMSPHHHLRDSQDKHGVFRRITICRFSAGGPSVHSGLFGCLLLQEQLLRFRADQTVQPTPGLELLAGAALAFMKSSFGCSAAGSSDRRSRESPPKFRSKILCKI